MLLEYVARVMRGRGVGTAMGQESATRHSTLLEYVTRDRGVEAVMGWV